MTLESKPGYWSFFLKVKFRVRVKEVKTHIGSKEAIASKELKMSVRMMLGNTRLRLNLI